MLSKSLKTLLGFSLLGFVAVWMGCSSDTSPVAPQAAGKTHLTLTSSTDSDGDGIPDADSDGDGIPDADSTTYITFADPNLTAAVWEALGWPVPTTRLITAADTDSLTTLNANGRGIKSLVGLEHATNLDTLHLYNNKITDVSPLASLTNLKRLNLRANKITDVSPLASLTNLETLILYANGISDVTPLAGLTNLETLHVTGNPLRGNVRPLAGLTNLERLKVNDTGIRDSGLSTLAASLTNLTYLDLSSNTISDLSPVTCLPNLERLRMRNVNDGSGPGNKYVATTSNIHIRYLIDKGVTIIWN